MMQNKRQMSPNMHQSLSRLLFPEYRQRVLTLLLLRPEEALHGREVARIPVVRLADAHAKGAAATFMVELAWPSRQFNGLLGACHGLEIGCTTPSGICSMLRGRSGIAGQRHDVGFHRGPHARSFGLARDRRRRGLALAQRLA